MERAKHRAALFSFIVSVLGGGIALAIGCTTESGTTPTCKNDLSEAGITADPNGCNPFPTCDKGPPEECCKDLKGTDHDFCIYGYSGATVAGVSASSSTGGPMDAGGD